MFTSPQVRLDALGASALDVVNRKRTSADFATNYLSTGALGDRISESALLERTKLTEALYENFESLFAEFNRQYGVVVDGIEEPISLIRYKEGGLLDWHLDCGEGCASRRKLSISIQLSARDAYAGGDLEFAGAASHTLARDQYAAIGFPAYLTHRVTAVTRGEREALVAWIHGPSFK
jgi:predicted 2-oxoglutarate/Fe(II)-dependent dioxygenase YbiX